MYELANDFNFSTHKKWTISPVQSSPVLEQQRVCYNDISVTGTVYAWPPTSLFSFHFIFCVLFHLVQRRDRLRSHDCVLLWLTAGIILWCNPTCLECTFMRQWQQSALLVALSCRNCNFKDGSRPPIHCRRDVRNTDVMSRRLRQGHSILTSRELMWYYARSWDVRGDLSLNSMTQIHSSVILLTSRGALVGSRASTTLTFLLSHTFREAWLTCQVLSIRHVGLFHYVMAKLDSRPWTAYNGCNLHHTDTWLVQYLWLHLQF
jgi:hypothetical protein